MVCQPCCQKSKVIVGYAAIGILHTMLLIIQPNYACKYSKLPRVIGNLEEKLEKALSRTYYSTVKERTHFGKYNYSSQYF